MSPNVNPSREVGAARRLSALLEGHAAIPASMDRDVQGLAIHSRDVSPGHVFFACPGARTHGKHYIHSALSAGAVGIVREDEDDGAGQGLKQQPGDGAIEVMVSDVVACVGDAAHRFYQRPSASMTVVGVTGTNGKTSVSHFLARGLGACGIAGSGVGVLGTVGNGVLGRTGDRMHHSALTTTDVVNLHRQLFDFKAQEIEAVVMEVSSHGLEQRRVAGVCFDLAILTNLSRDHLDYHRNMQAYAEVKARLFRRPELAAVVLNADEPLGRDLRSELEGRVAVWTYGVGPPSTREGRCERSLRATEVMVSPHGLSMKVQGPFGDEVVRLPLLGRFNATNALAAITAMAALGGSWSDVFSAVASFDAVPGRMEAISGSPHQALVVVDYAHTPDALKRALESLREHCRAELWCVFGCGGDRDAGKRPMMGEIAERIADRVVLTDDNPRSENGDEIIAGIRTGMVGPPERVECNREAAIRYALARAGAADIVLVAGKGHESYQEVAGEQHPFDDREVVRRLLEALS